MPDMLALRGGGFAVQRLTNRQKRLLSNIDRITGRRKNTGSWGFFLDGEDCTHTINTLIVRRLIAKINGGEGLKLLRRPETLDLEPTLR